jgi:hypothetical protein
VPKLFDGHVASSLGSPYLFYHSFLGGFSFDYLPLLFLDETIVSLPSGVGQFKVHDDYQVGQKE